MNGFDTGSPTWVAIRWLWFLSITGVVGAVAFRYAVLNRLGDLAPATRADALRRTARAGFASALFATAAAVLRLPAQAIAVFGEIGADTGILITATAWGRGWLLHVAAAPAAALAFLASSRGRNGAWPVAALAALALALTPGLAGHATASGRLTPVTLVADVLHVTAAGGWIGGLLLVMTAGIPAARTNEPDNPRSAVVATVNAFSPLALSCAALLLVTGLLAAWVHIGSISAVTRSSYGRTFLIKLALLLPLAGLGTYNFRRLKPRLARPGTLRQLRRTAAAELIAGAAVLLITAVFVATEPPADDVGAGDLSAAITSRSPSVNTRTGDPSVIAARPGPPLRTSPPRPD